MKYDSRSRRVISEDIAEISCLDLEEYFGIKKGELDLLSGGAPCQVFSCAGKHLKKFMTFPIIYQKEEVSMEYQNLTHIFEPVYNKDSRILILGTFPSVKSRENHFYYGHPQNRFWRVLASLVQASVEAEEENGKKRQVQEIVAPKTIEEKKEFLLKNHIAVWDVIHSCDISGSSDSSIKNVVPNNLNVILENCNIRRIFANGATAGKYYKKYMEAESGKEIIVLPSTSPANAAFSLERLVRIWGDALSEYLFS